MSVCVDHVTDLGTFLEVELLAAADDSGSAVLDRLDAFVQTLAVTADLVLRLRGHRASHRPTSAPL